MLQKTLSVIALVALLATSGMSQVWLATNPFNSDMRFVDLATGADLLVVPMTSTMTVTGINGLARHPVTGDLYAIAKLSGQTNRWLGTLDAKTQVLTLIGDTGEKFAGITFDAAGTLYGVSGDGGNVSETLFTIDVGTAAITLVTALGNGDDGETIAYNSNDGLIYHMSGLGTPNLDEICETIDPVTLTINPVVLAGFDASEIFSLTYDAASDLLVWSDINSRYGTLDSLGTMTLLGTLTQDSRGFLPALIEELAPIGVFPGTGEDFDIEVLRNSVSEVAVHALDGGDFSTLRFFSAGGAFVYQDLYVVGEIYATGNPDPLSPFPGIAVTGNPMTTFIIFGGPTPGLGQILVLPPDEGFQFSYLHVGSLSGFDVMIQGISSTAGAANMIFATTEGRRITFN